MIWYAQCGESFNITVLVTLAVHWTGRQADSDDGDVGAPAEGLLRAAPRGLRPVLARAPRVARRPVPLKKEQLP